MLKIDILYPKLLSIVILLIALFAVAAVSFPVGLLMLTLSFIAFLKTKNYEELLCFILLLVLWQNTWIAFAAGYIESRTIFNFLHGINFIIPFIFFFLILAILRSLTKPFFYLWLLTLLVVIMLCGASVLGGIRFGFAYSVSYLRLFLGPLLLFWVGFWLAGKTSFEFFTKALKFIFIVSFGITVFQFIFPNLVISLLNDDRYYGWKVQTESVEDVVKYLNSNSYLNLPIGLKLARAGGMVKSFISNAYLLIILATLLYWKRSKIYTWIAVIIIAICCGSKGAVLLFLLFNIFTFLRRTFSFSIVMIIFGGIWIALVYAGLYFRSEHMVGFVSGAKYLNTLGNGFGFSGNLSPVRLKSWDGPPLNDLGYWTRFQNGSESAFGVLFSSLGIFSMLYIFFELKIIAVARKQLERRYEYACVLSLVMIMQGIFQEEAYSPFALGLAMLYLGFISASNKETEADVVKAS
jgi:hypothetical protein